MPWTPGIQRLHTAGERRIARFLPQCIGSLALSLVVCTQSTRADDTHYRGVPIGSHSVGLGTAFVGVADDSSAAYHNPAGLVEPQTFGIAGSLTALTFDYQQDNDGFSTSEDQKSLKTKGQRLLPVFVAAVTKFGPKNKRGIRKYAIGYSVASTDFQPR
ncbi:MAG: hypothetical protein R3A47_05520 [Polyangiales bacterium]